MPRKQKKEKPKKGDRVLTSLNTECVIIDIQWQGVSCSGASYIRSIKVLFDSGDVQMILPTDIVKILESSERQ